MTDPAAASSYPIAIVTAVVALAIGITIHFLTVRKREGNADIASRPGWLARLVRLGLLACVLTLGLTAFGTVLTEGAMHGYPLMIHTAAGGAVTVVLVLFGFLWAGRRRASGGSIRGTFWLVILLGFVSAATMLASMFPLYGTATLELLLDVHRWSGLALFVVAPFHVYLAWRARA